MNPAQPTPDVSDAKPSVACAPVTTMPPIPDNPTEEVVKEILLTLDQMKFLHDDGPVVVRRSKTTSSVGLSGIGGIVVTGAQATDGFASETSGV
ncbi:MAG: hypothetical protein NT154_15115, partial [Verrucomicrobia bacterium]|nr:hypothetical protein [Verrucomicrobiota bacterium]